MPVSEQIAYRINLLDSELVKERDKAYGLAKSAYLWSQFLFTAAILCSVAAAICGLFFNLSGKAVGGIAALPAILAFIAVNLKLEARASWHYRRAYEMNELHSRLLYQLPETPTADNVAAIAKDRDTVINKMHDEWDKTITVNWAEMLKQRQSLPKPQSNEPPTKQPSD